MSSVLLEPLGQIFALVHGHIFSLRSVMVKRRTTMDQIRPNSRGITIGFWTVTALFCLQIGFTAYAQLTLPQVAEAFARLGFPDYFRVELAWAKLLGIVLLLAPVPARLKEWAYAGFAITLVSALIAHVSIGEGPEAWGWAAGTGVLWGLSYFFWRRAEAVLETQTLSEPRNPLAA
jgi:hypothetical protein